MATVLSDLAQRNSTSMVLPPRPLAGREAYRYSACCSSMSAPASTQRGAAVGLQGTEVGSRRERRLLQACVSTGYSRGQRTDMKAAVALCKQLHAAGVTSVLQASDVYTLQLSRGSAALPALLPAHVCWTSKAATQMACMGSQPPARPAHLAAPAPFAACSSPHFGTPQTPKE